MEKSVEIKEGSYWISNQTGAVFRVLLPPSPLALGKILWHHHEVRDASEDYILNCCTLMQDPEVGSIWERELDGHRVEVVEVIDFDLTYVSDLPNSRSTLSLRKFFNTHKFRRAPETRLEVGEIPKRGQIWESKTGPRSVVIIFSDSEYVEFSETGDPLKVKISLALGEFKARFRLVASLKVHNPPSETIVPCEVTPELGNTVSHKIDLLPCPFCGSEADITANEYGAPRAGCTNEDCGARLPDWLTVEKDHSFFEKLELVAEYWNKRV